MTDHDAEGHHGEDYRQCGDDGRNAHLYNLLEREVESEREQQEHHTDVRPSLDVRIVHNRHRVGHVRTDNKASHDIAQHERLLQFLE